MAGCGYVCPLCEGSGMLEDGKECLFCQTTSPPMAMKVSITGNEEWIRSVHEGPCCWDDGKEPQ